jgi:hypothetical protein
MLGLDINLSAGGGSSDASSGDFNPVYGSSSSLIYVVGAIGTLIVIGLIIYFYKKA